MKPKFAKIELFYTPEGRRVCSLNVSTGQSCKSHGSRKCGFVDYCLLACRDLDRKFDHEQARYDYCYTPEWCPLDKLPQTKR